MQIATLKRSGSRGERGLPHRDPNAALYVACYVRLRVYLDETFELVALSQVHITCFVCLRVHA